jgi:2'-5' RNA ligase
MNTIRSFIAIPLSVELISQIEKIQNQLKKIPTDVKWVNPSSIHLTLKFLGNIEATQIEKIAQGIQNGIKGISKWIAEVKDIGAFPSLKNPRVIWVGIEDERNQLVNLQKRIEKEMEKLGFKREERKFSPHLTLGRVRSSQGKSELVKYLLQPQEPFSAEINIDQVVLFKSDLKPTGAEYTRLKEFSLI